MTPIVFLIQGGSGDLFFGKSFALKLARLLCRKVKEQGVKCCSSLHFLDNLVGT